MTLPPTESEDEPFRRLFQATDTSLPDEGFTAAVLARLPASQRHVSFPAVWWGAIGAAVGLGIASVAIALAPERFDRAVKLAEIRHTLAPLVTDPTVSIAACLIAACLGIVSLILRRHAPGLK